MISGQRDNGRGIVLIVTLWVLTILAILALSFAQTMHVEARAAANEMQRTRAYYAAQAGIQRVILAISEDQTGFVSPLSEWAYLDSAEEEFPFPDDEHYEVSLTDECGKIDLNWADQELLEQLPTMTPELIDCILDWRDADDDPRPDGAEADYYARLRPPRMCANRAFLTLPELLLVKGMTKETFYGSIVDRPIAVTVAAEEPSEDELPPLTQLLTLYGGMDDMDAQGQERLNINTATADELTERTQDLLSEDDVQAIVAARPEDGFSSIGDLLQVGGMTRDKMIQLADLITTKSAATATEGEGQGDTTPGEQPPGTGPGEPTVPTFPGMPGGGTGGPSVPFPIGPSGDRPGQALPGLPGGPPMPPGFPSPVPNEPQPTPPEPGEDNAGGESQGSELPTPDEYRPGIYNINTAPIEVLSTVEGMTEQVLQAIVRQREKEPFTTRGELLNLPEVTNESFSQLVETISVRSSSLRITSIGSVEEGRVRVKITAFLDLKGEQPQVIFVAQG